jgi:hypothetical protein
MGRAWRRRRRANGDRGSVLVESALMIPILFFAIFAIFEFGGALLSYSTTSDLIRTGSRAAAVTGADPMADQQILVAMARNVDAIPDAELAYIVIWHSTGPGETAPTGLCAPATTSATVPNTTSVGTGETGSPAHGACNVYLKPSMPGGAFDMALGKLVNPASFYFGCTSGMTTAQKTLKVDCNWLGASRRVVTTPLSVSPAHGTDFVGIFAKADHAYYTKVVGTTLTITDQVIVPLEPEGYSAT